MGYLNVFVAIFALQCSLSLATLAGFGEQEHMFIGNTGSVRILNAAGQEVLARASSKIFTSGFGYKLSYGQVLALSGDWFGPEEQGGVICHGEDEAERERRFMKIHEEMMLGRPFSCPTTCGRSYIPRIFKEVQKQIVLNKVAISKGAEPSTVASELGNARWIVNAFGRSMLRKSEYNNDHFSGCAKIAFETGHMVAQRTAYEAGNPQLTPQESAQMLNKAYMLNAMADHFGTDLHASGHVRNPRDLINNVCGVVGSKQSGFTCKRMHDEDNANGLLVKNKRGDLWWTYGDGMFFDSVAKDCRRISSEGVQASRDDVWAAFEAGRQQQPFEPKYTPLDYIPDMQLTEQDPTAELSNTCALYKDVGGVLHIRTPHLNPRSPASAAYIAGQTYVGLATQCDYRVFETQDCAGTIFSNPKNKYEEPLKAFVGHNRFRNRKV